MPYEFVGLTDDEAQFKTGPNQIITIPKKAVEPKTWNKIVSDFGEKKEKPDEDKIRISSKVPELVSGFMGDTAEEKILRGEEPPPVKTLKERTIEKAAAEAQANLKPTVVPEQTAPQAPAPLAPTSIQPTGVMAPAMAPMAAETTVSQVKPSADFKKYQKSLEKSYGQFAEATKIKAESELADAEFMAIETEKASQQAAVNLADIKKTEDDYRTRLAEVRERSNQISERLENYQFKKFFEGREGAKVMAGLAVAMGAVGSAFTGQPNTALQIIQTSIENDLAIQKANYEKLKGSLEANESLFGQIRQAGLDETQSRYTFMKTRYDQTIQQAKAISERMTSAEQKARMDAVVSQLQIQRDEALMKAEEANKTQVTTTLKPMQGMLPIDREKSIKEFEENTAKSPIGEAQSAAAAARRFQELRRMGGQEAAIGIANFVAGKEGLGQGSYSPAYTEMLKSIGLADRPIEYIQKQLSGEQSKTLLNAIEAFYEKTAQHATERAVNYMGASGFQNRARSIGYDPNYYIGSMHVPTVQRMMSTGGQTGVRRLP